MSELVEKVRQFAARELAGSKRPRLRLQVIAAESAAVAARCTDQARAQLPPPEPIACDSGCAWCCHLPVALTLPELAALVTAVEKWPAAEREALRARLRTLAPARRDDSQWASRQPCPLLDEHKRCRVYEVRPLACRGLNSFSARRCESHFFAGKGSLRAWSPQFDLHREVRDGLAAAFELPLLELVAALDLALGMPEERWLNPKSFSKASFNEALPGFRERK